MSVSAPAGCAWTATAQAPFLTVASSANSGVGDGGFRYYVAGNVTGSPRTGGIGVGSANFTVSQRAPTGGSFLSFVSDAGDYIGDGMTQFWEAPTTAFRVAVDNLNESYPITERNRIYVSFNGSDGLVTYNWNLDLAAPKGQQLLAGAYLNATRAPFQAPTVPGLDFSGFGRGCNTLSGEFTIGEAVYAASGSIQRLRVTFEQHCEGRIPALRGEFFFVR